MKSTEEQKQEIIKELNKLAADGGCIEVNHIFADNLLCALLINLGYEDVVDAYNEIDKHYA
jgi:hypothetical protein